MLAFRVFISSPGDVAIERQRADNVLSRLNGEATGLARLTAVRWETEHYQAHETFQTQIPPSTECDVVIGILKWRLGTALPPGFDQLPDGQPYPSGTAYELLTAIDKRRAGGDLPDVFVFRYAGGEPSVRLNDPRRAAIERDWELLCGFFERWFYNRDGHFLAAFNSYEPKDKPHPQSAEDDFERQLEALLRKWLAGKLAGGRLLTWPAVKGSPYRALEAFGAKHAAVFFGRGRDIRVAMDLLRDAAAKEQRFLLVVGASGAGKSSLARAGLIPRLVTPGVVAEVDLWRIAVTRPGDSPHGPFASLATALLMHAAALPSEEEGRGAALPEIADGDAETPVELASLLAHADASAAKTVVKALGRVGARTKELGHHERDQRCDLILLVDQLDELFAPSVATEVRERYAALLAALIASGRVWVVATLRDDFYPAMLKLPALKELKDAGASYDLAPPGAVELAEIVRAPAEAAGLSFDAEPATGERLDERLLREADRADMLPLVQLVLSRLWDARVMRGDTTVLPLAAYEALGGVQGITAEAGERALQPLDAGEQARLAPLVRRLAERQGSAGTLTIRAVPLTEAAPDAPARTLVDALVVARLLTLASADDRQDRERGTGDAAVSVRLSHQRVLFDWPRAAAIVADSADFYRVRDEVEAQRRRWEAGGRRGELLLARGLPLAEARAMADKYGGELPPSTHAYIAASRRRAARAQTLGYAAAAVFALVATGAGIEAKIAADRSLEAEVQRQAAEMQRQAAEMQRGEAEAQKQEAEAQKLAAQKNFAAAKSTVDGLIFNIAQGLKNVSGMRVETIRTVLETVRHTVDRLLATAPDDPQLLRSRAAMLNNFAATYRTAGDLKSASAAAAESLATFRKLAALDPTDAAAQRELSISLSQVGDVDLLTRHQAGALSAYQESLDIARKLGDREAGDPQAQQDLAGSLEKIGDVKLLASDRTGALAAYEESFEIRRKLAASNSGNAQAQRELSVSLYNVGSVKLLSGDVAGALSADQKSLDIRRKLAARDPGNTLAQKDVSDSLNGIGDANQKAGDQAGSLAAYEESLDILRKLAAGDAGNAEAQSGVEFCLRRIGDVKLRSGDRAGALFAYEEGIDIARKLVAQDSDTGQARRDLAFNLLKMGNIKDQVGDHAGALAACEEALEIVRTLATLDAGDAQAKINLEYTLAATSLAALMAKDYASALHLSDEAIALAPDQIWLHGNRAHALMLLGRTSEARALYLKYRGKIAGGTTTWEKAVTDDFAMFRKNGFTDPLMDEIEADFAKPI